MLIDTSPPPAVFSTEPKKRVWQKAGRMHHSQENLGLRGRFRARSPREEPGSLRAGMILTRLRGANSFPAPFSNKLFSVWMLLLSMKPAHPYEVSILCVAAFSAKEKTLVL